jgi:hypothetical protein
VNAAAGRHITKKKCSTYGWGASEKLKGNIGTKTRANKIISIEKQEE